jgi:hypothetical protein
MVPTAVLEGGEKAYGSSRERAKEEEINRTKFYIQNGFSGTLEIHCPALLLYA